MIKRACLSLLSTTLLALPVDALAGVSDWAVNPGGRMRIVALSPDSTGKVEGVIEIEPTPGWITYWREPGDAGMPPQMTLAPQSGLTLSHIDFPVPQRFDQNGVSDIGYDEPVALPFTLSATGKAGDELDATVFIGVCKEICVPFQAELSTSLVSFEDASARPIIEAAKTHLPEKPSAEFFAEKPKVGADGKTVSVTVGLPDVQDKPEFYLTGPDGYVYFDPLLQRADMGKVIATFPLDTLPRQYSFSGKTWRLLVKSGSRAMETPLVFD